MLQVENICKNYDSFALKNISFELRPGEIAGFVGVNGAGKTTTIKTILGLIRPDSGVVRLFGSDYSHQENYIKNRLGVVLDDGYFYSSFTLKKMKKLVASSYHSWNEDQFQMYLHRFRLNEEQTIEKLSKGMKMKFALALALSHGASLLVMDEPTSGLDPLMRDQLAHILSEYVANGENSVFFSTHVTSDLDKIADSVIFIHEGQVVFQKDKKSLLQQHHSIEEAMINWIGEKEKC